MKSSFIALSLCLGLTACGWSSTEESPYVQPNDLMAAEIQDRISQIPYQQSDELMGNLIWLEQAGEQAIPAMLQALQSDNPKVRSNVLWVLGRVRDRRTISSMQPLVQDPNEKVRLEAARTLVTMGDMQHTPVLIDALDSDLREVRYMCHNALRRSTGRDFGYDHLDEDLVSRRRATYRWRKWWADQSGDPWFAKDYATDHSLDVFEAENDWQVGSEPATPAGETDPIDGEENFIEVVEPDTSNDTDGDTDGDTDTDDDPSTADTPIFVDPR